MDQLPKNDKHLTGLYGNPLIGEFNITWISSTMFLNYCAFGQGYLVPIAKMFKKYIEFWYSTNIFSRWNFKTDGN